MEFKDRLKKLRIEKHVSQQELANSIYVSRSAIAKWENGLGLPNETSYKALLTFFNVSREEFPLNEETENISIVKNKKIRNLWTAIISLLSLVIIILFLTFVNAFSNGYGFTSKMAVGKIWADNKTIKTSEYDFYYDTFGGVDDIKVINSFCVVENKLIGYQKINDIENYKKTARDHAGNVLGYIYSFKGEKCYYHFFKSVYQNNQGEIGVTINLLNEITIKEDTISVLYNSYFETPFDLKEFYANGKHYIIE